MNSFDFKKRTAVITGGAQGFGLDIAKRFLNSGAMVFIWDIDEDLLKKVTNEINNPNLFYPYVQRLLSGVSHLSVDEACDILCEVGNSSQKIVLSHISENTNSYENTYKKVMASLEGGDNSPEIIMSFQDEETDWI